MFIPKFKPEQLEPGLRARAEVEAIRCAVPQEQLVEWQAADFIATQAAQIQALTKALGDLMHVSEGWYKTYCETLGLTFRPHAQGQTPCVVQARAALAAVGEKKP